MMLPTTWRLYLVLASSHLLFSMASAFVATTTTFSIRPSTANRHPSSRTTTTTWAMSSSEPLFHLNPSETALVFIEYQNEFATPGGKLHEAVKDCMDQTNMLANSARLAQFGRDVGCAIVHCPINFEPGHYEISKTPYGILKGVKDGAAFTNGEWGADFNELMKPRPGDLVVKGKSGLCGFMSTNLDFLLRQAGAKNLILGGFLTNCCVESTMRTGYEKGYQVYTLKDCVAATSQAAQDATLEYNFGMFSVVTTSDEVMRALQTPVSA